MADGIAQEGTPLKALFAPEALRAKVPALADTADEAISDALADLAETGDAAALAELGQLGVALGRAIAFACVVMDPGEVVLKGALSRALPSLWGSMKPVLDAETYYHGNLPFRVYSA